MTLEKKFKDVGFNITELVEIADEFAIEFVEWCKQNYDIENTPFHNKWLTIDGEYVSTKELLIIFKNDKNKK